MLEHLKESLIEATLPSSIRNRIDTAPLNLNSVGFDPWGLHPDSAKLFAAALRKIYTDYFRVECQGIEKLPRGRVLLVANHSGQLPWDGLLIAMSLLLEASPPRVARALLERWAPSIPFVSSLLSRCGAVVGDPRNCRDLLERDECTLVFPEGARGLGKSIFKRYQLQRFGSGFVRLALETNSPIMPVAVIGCEEAYPGLANLKPLANLLKAPYFPITPLFPWFGALGALPLPTKVTLRYGDPIYLKGDPDAPDSEIDQMVGQVKKAIQTELNEGVRRRGGRIFTGSARDVVSPSAISQSLRSGRFAP